MAISVDTLQRKMAEPVILADCFYKVICRGFAKWLHPRRNLRPAPPLWLRMALRRTAVSAAMVAPCVGDVLRAAARRPTKNSVPPRQKNFNPEWIFSIRWILESKKTRGALRKKYQATTKLKKILTPENLMQDAK